LGRIGRSERGVGTSVAKRRHEIALQFFSRSRRAETHAFWERFVEKEELQGCDALEKLLAGCEIIAALDCVDLLPV
jgi:hypothetical protein